MFSVGDVFTGLWVNVLLHKTKVNDMDNVLVRGAVPSHEKILWLHVSVYQVLTVHILNSGYLCVCVCVYVCGGEGGVTSPSAPALLVLTEHLA